MAKKANRWYRSKVPSRYFLGVPGVVGFVEKVRKGKWKAGLGRGGAYKRSEIRIFNSERDAKKWIESHSSKLDSKKWIES